MKEWKENWNLGITSIDEQHKNILRAINAIDDSLEKQDKPVNLLKLIQALNAYAKIHFQFEEQTMKKFKYKNSAEHIEEHDEFKHRIIIFESKVMKKENISELKNDIKNYLTEWLIHHILITDKKYKSLFVLNNIT